MAEKRPICLYGSQLGELRPGDRLPPTTPVSAGSEFPAEDPQAELFFYREDISTMYMWSTAAVGWVEVGVGTVGWASFRLLIDDVTSAEIKPAIVSKLQLAESEAGPTKLLEPAYCSASSASGGAPAYNVLGDNTSVWWETTETTPPHWWRYDFPGLTRIQEVRLLGLTGYLQYMPKDFHIQGTQNGTTWVTLASFYDESWVAGVWRKFTID
jgi:hypothetical protein